MRSFIPALFLLPLLLGSKPVEGRWVGCVVDGTFYSLSIKGQASPFFTGTFDLASAEGKAVALHGFLSPAFFRASAERPIEVLAPTCDAVSVRMIRDEQAFKLISNAGAAIRDGNCDRAEALTAAAMARVDDPRCNVFLGRARLRAKCGVVDAAMPDIELMLGGRCRAPRTMFRDDLFDLAVLVMPTHPSTAGSLLELAKADCEGNKDCEDRLAVMRRSLNEAQAPPPPAPAPPVVSPTTPTTTSTTP